MYHRSCMYSKYRVDGGLVGVVVSRLLFPRQLGFFPDIVLIKCRILGQISSPSEVKLARVLAN